MKKIILLVIIFFFVSCKNENQEIIQYDKQGKIVSKAYMNNDEESLDSILYFNDGMMNSKMVFSKENKLSFYTKFYNKNGLESEGNTIYKIKDGKWKYYDSKNRLRKIVEYKNICNEEYANQEFNYDDKGRLIAERSTYYTHKFKDPKFELNKVNELTVNYVPFIKKGTTSLLVFSPEFDSSFCNINTVKKDSVSTTTNLTFKIDVSFGDKGKNNFRGYILEYYYKETSENVFTRREKKTFINIPVVVE